MNLSTFNSSLNSGLNTQDSFFHMLKKTFGKIIFFLWDLWCIVSLIGIWPRFIETRILKLNRIDLKIQELPSSLDGLKILQISDLHLYKYTPKRILRKTIQAAEKTKPDIIVFTGDFLSYSKIANKKELRSFLCSFQAPYGCYAVLGNHDYQRFISLNDQGDYDIKENRNSTLFEGLRRLFKLIHPTKRVTERAKTVGVHTELLQLLKETPFHLLHNENKVVHINKDHLNLCGLGEHMLGDTRPEKAFQNYERKHFGIILVHNPDAIHVLLDYPGEVILCGHTHGAQINLPWLRERFMIMENPELARGLFKLGKKWVYVNRGIGSSFNFRWRSIPEVLLLTLRKK